MKRLKRILIICLACVLIFNTAYKPIKAEAAEAGIIGGALASAGVALTVPQIALLVAAAGGCVYLYTHREEVAETLVTVLDKAAENVENGKEQLQKWWDRAVLGYIAIDTAADFIKDGVKDWVSGLYDGSHQPAVSTPSGVDALGNPLFENGSRVSGKKISYNITPGCFLCGNFYVYKFYQVINDTPEVFHVLLNTYVWGNSGLTYMNINKDTMDDYLVITNRIYPNDGTGRPYYNIAEYINATSASDIKALKTLIQGARKVNRADHTYLYNSYINTSGFDGSSNTPFISSLSPDVVGGVSDVLDSGYTIANVNLPDLLIDGTGSICPDTTLTGEDVFSGSVADTMTGLATGTMTWSDYITDVGVAAPTVSIPDAEDETITNDFVITDTGVSDTVVDNTATSDPELDQYKVQIRDFFPFCLPFDMVDFLSVLAADPEAPVFEIKFPALDGSTVDLTVDLSPWDGVAQLLRNLELLALIIGLCFKTRDIIRS